MDEIRDQLLFDYYGELLTSKQREILNYYFNSDYSLAEIAKLLGTSRQSVYDSIHRSLKSLEGYEKKLQMISDDQKRKSDLERLLRIVSGLEVYKDGIDGNYQINSAKQLLKRMIEENGI